MFGESAHGVEAASRLLKKSIRGLFQHAKQKAAAPAPPCARDAQGGASVAGGRMPRATGIRASCTAWFLLCFIVQTLSVFEQWRYFLRCAFLLRLKARAGLPWPARSAGGRSTGPSSDSASPLYRDRQEAQVPCPTGK